MDRTVSISISKLRQLLRTNGIHIQAFFIDPDNKKVRFIQCISQSAITILVSVPSEYLLKSDQPRITWDITQINLDGPDEVPEEILDEYAENLQDHLDAVDTSEQGLRQGYDVEIDLSAGNTPERTELKDIVNQLDRLKHAVTGIPYSLCVAYGSYLVYMASTRNIKGYHIEEFTHRKNTRRLYVVANLEVVYTKMSVLVSDTEKIYGSITGILTKNQKRLAKGLTGIIRSQQSTLEMTTSLNQRALQLRREIARFGELFRQTNATIETLESRVQGERETTVYEDLSGTAAHTNRAKLQRARDLKGKIADKLTALRETYEYLVLNADKILFENILSLEKVVTNLETLRKIADS